ncbi:MAG: 50S ribosomal protein L6 [Candidatus Promineifilaceae bacterium]|nr:50S ribosomal protein L6 [Candidatus Promineifilaceae bacterium]
MSRIGNTPVEVPDKVKVNIDGSNVSVTGPKGTLEQRFNPEMQIALEEGAVVVSRPTDQRHHKALHGLTRSLIDNMVRGVSEGYTRRLQIEGVGYRAETRGNTLVLHVGYSHPVEFEPPQDVSFTVEDRGRTIIVEGTDKQVVGELCAKIRKTRPPEPYKGKGIRYEGERVRRKAGKAGKV